MNYQKLDTELAGLISEGQAGNAPNLNIFIHTGGAPTAEQTDFLKRQGVADAQLQRPIITATVSARTVRELSEQPWVRYLKLSSQLRLVDTE